MMEGGFSARRKSSSSSPDTVIQQKIEDQITCPVCFEIYREPKALSCLHVFCLLCLKAAAEKAKAGELCCPQCRKPVETPKGGLSALQSAFHVNNLIEIYEMIKEAKSPTGVSPSLCANCPGSAAEYFCPQCSHILCTCKDCHVIHGKWPKYSQHVLSPLSGAKDKPLLFCDSHPSQPLTQYCQECKLLICEKCLLDPEHSAHAQHTANITDALHQCKDAILATLEPIRRQLSTVEGAIERIKGKKIHVTEQAANVKSSIDKELGSLQKAMEQRRDTLKEMVGREEEGKMESLQAQEDKAEVARLQLSNYLEGINHCLQKGSSQQVFTMHQAVEEKVKEIVQEFQFLPLAPTEEANLHFSCGKEIAATLESFGAVYSSGITASNCCVFGEGLGYATVGLETSVVVTYVGGSKQGSWCKHVDVDLYFEGDSGKLVVTRREVNELEKQIVLHYVPVTKGRYKLHVTLYGREVANGPFDLTVMAPFQFYGTFSNSVKQLKRPWGVTVTQSGQLVVVDNQGWDGIHVFESNGSKVRSFAPLAMVPSLVLPEGQCHEPRGVAIGKDGNLLVVDGKGHRIQSFSPDGVSCHTVGSLGKQPLQFNDPVGITVTRSGEVLVCDRRNNRVQVLNSELTYLRQIGQPGGQGDQDSHLYLPWDVACDSQGQIYIADCGNFCVKVFTRDGEYIRKIGSEGTAKGHFKFLSSIYIDHNDYLYALDKERACVTVFDPQGEFKMRFGTPGQLEGQFYEPLGIAVDSKGLVYVSDGYALGVRSHGRVQVFE